MSVFTDYNHFMKLVLERQWLHAVLLAALLIGVSYANRLEGLTKGALWGLDTAAWFWIAIGIPILHQVYVLICWRTELHFGLVTRVLGKGGFKAYAVGFSIIGLARVAAVFLLAAANPMTLPADPVRLKIAAVVVALPALYTFYSVKRYFTATRAFGIDHFDERFRTRPFVRKGIFRFTQNGMYLYGFLILWSAALWFGSLAALIAALFNHLYIWVHFFCTEKPDMQRIYGKR